MKISKTSENLVKQLIGAQMYLDFAVSKHHDEFLANRDESKRELLERIAKLESDAAELRQLKKDWLNKEGAGK